MMKRFAQKLTDLKSFVIIWRLRRYGALFLSRLRRYGWIGLGEASSGSSPADPTASVPDETPAEMSMPLVAENGTVEALVINPAWPRHQLTKFRPPDLTDVPADAIWVKDGRPFVVLHYADQKGLPEAKGEVLWPFPYKNRFGLARVNQEWVPLTEGYRYDTAGRILAPLAMPAPKPAPKPAAVTVDASATPAAPELAASNGHSSNGTSPNGASPVALPPADLERPPTNQQVVKEAIEGAFSSQGKPLRPVDFGEHLDMRLIKQRRSSVRQEALQKALDKAKPYNWIALALVLGVVAILYMLGQSS